MPESKQVIAQATAADRATAEAMATVTARPVRVTRAAPVPWAGFGHGPCPHHKASGRKATHNCSQVFNFQKSFFLI
jgi:hypothetical protein